jgi:hypothetical protein
MRAISVGKRAQNLRKGGKFFCAGENFVCQENVRDATPIMRISIGLGSLFHPADINQRICVAQPMTADRISSFESLH